MYLFYTMMRLFPFWAVPLALVCGEIGMFYYRKQSWIRYYIWSVGGFLVLATLLWLIFRGDLYSDQWMNYLTGK